MRCALKASIAFPSLVEFLYLYSTFLVCLLEVSCTVCVDYQICPVLFPRRIQSSLQTMVPIKQFQSSYPALCSSALGLPSFNSKNFVSNSEVKCSRICCNFFCKHLLLPALQHEDISEFISSYSNWFSKRSIVHYWIIQIWHCCFVTNVVLF